MWNRGSSLPSDALKATKRYQELTKPVLPVVQRLNLLFYSVGMSGHPAGKPSGKRPRPPTEDEDIVEGGEAFENAPRLSQPAWLDDGSTRLPVKLADGSVRRQAGRPTAQKFGNADESDGEGDDSGDEDFSDEDADDEDADADEGEVDEPKRDAKQHTGAGKKGQKRDILGPMPFAELSRLPSKELEERRVSVQARIADLAERIISAPEHNLSAPAAGKEKLQLGKPGVGRTLVSKKQNSLASLHGLCGDGDPVVRRLTMLSCVAVFKDIVPSYRIRAAGAAEGGEGSGGTKVKKDVRKLRDYEAALLAGYQRFLKFLEWTVSEGERAERRMRRRKDGAPDGAPAGSSDGDAGGGAGPAGAGFESDAYHDGDYKDDDGEGGEGGSQAGGSKREWASRKDFNKVRMDGKRAAKAARDGTVAYEGADDGTVSALGLDALRCMAALLSALHHFNFRSNLVNFLAPRASAQSDAASAVACSALSDLFASDTSLEASTEAARALQSAVKAAVSRPGGLRQVRPEALQTLQKIRLGVLERSDRERALSAARGGKGKGGKGKGGKDPYDKDDVLAGLKTADAEALTERQAAAKSALRATVGVYFRIVRAPGAAGAHLLGPTLGGLARIAHLIDVGVVSDLLAALKALLAASAGMGVAQLINAGEAEADSSDEEGGGAGKGSGGAATGAKLPAPVAFNAVLSALRIMGGPGELLNADETEFAHFLYGSLLRLSQPGGYEHTLLAVGAVQALLVHRRELSHERVGAFVKRLLLLALPAPPPAALALLACARQLLHRYSAVAALLGPPTERSHAVFPPGLADVNGTGAGSKPAATVSAAAGGHSNGGKAGKKGGKQPASSTSASGGGDSGAHSSSIRADQLAGLVTGSRGAVFDSDRSLSLGSTAWELALLASHAHPAVAASAAAAARNAPLAPAEAPEVVFRQFSEPFTATGDVLPPVAPPRPPAYVVQQQRAAQAAAAAAASGKELTRKERRRMRARLHFATGLPDAPAPWLAEESGPVASEALSLADSASASSTGSGVGIELFASLQQHYLQCEARLEARAGQVVTRVLEAKARHDAEKARAAAAAAQSAAAVAIAKGRGGAGGPEGFSGSKKARKAYT